MEGAFEPSILHCIPLGRTSYVGGACDTKEVQADSISLATYSII